MEVKQATTYTETAREYIFDLVRFKICFQPYLESDLNPSCAETAAAAAASLAAVNPDVSEP